MTTSSRQFSAAIVAAAVVLAVSSYAGAQPLLQLDYDAAKVFGSVQIAGGAIDITSGAMIVTTSSFGFVPDGYFNGTKQVLFPDEYGKLNVAEFGDAAIHDALLEGDDLAAGGYWNGTNGIFSSTADNNPDSNTGVGWVDNSVDAYSSFRGLAVNTSESIIGYAYYGDALLSGSVTALDKAVVSFSIATGGTTGLYGDFGSTINGQPEGMEWIDGDFYQDGSVGPFDLLTVEFNMGLPALYDAGPVTKSFSSMFPVPEPVTSSSLAVAAACAVGYRIIPRRVRRPG